MRFNTFRFLIREGFRGMAKNSFMSAASILVLVCCLLITGSAYLLTENIDHGFDEAYEENVVVAYAIEGLSESELADVTKQIKRMDNVAAVEFKSKDMLLKEYINDPDIGSLLADLQDDNPLPDTYTIHFKDLELFDKTVEEIKQIRITRTLEVEPELPEGDVTDEEPVVTEKTEKINAIETMEYNAKMAKMLTNARKMVFTVGIWVVALLLLVSLFIIINTIKLTVYSRRLEVYIMRSVGATRRFIRFPFVVEGIVLGIIAGGVAYGIIYGVYLLVGQLVEFGKNFNMIAFDTVWWQLLAGFMGIGVVIGILGSWISLSRYLKENMD